ncbi:SCO family protein [Nocardioides humilatus]|uniref:SCO family protein n=1 Tax=Nocardioides humilatus TaxID=2607660 RepID=A0A5B1LCD0_9ACTN|nr:SCO family protein [Nocardioides humilatus]KAA1417878.1 SCO family protein [Nocardioides humilatus]
MRRGLAVGVTAVAFLLAACGGEPEEFSGIELDQPYAAPTVELTDTDGLPYSIAADNDKPLTLVFFGYTHCPDVCPLVMNNIAAGLNRLDESDRDDVAMVFVTTDPERDDEQVLRAYLDGYGKDFIGLTGDLADIIAAGDPLHLYVNDGKKLPTGGYDLGGHSTYVLGIDDHDEATVIWNQETSATEFASDIHTLLSED